MDINDYIALFSRMHLDKNTKRWAATTTYRAPHKPFLLLSILDLFAQGTIQKNLIEITPQLGELFAGYWSKVMPAGSRGNFALPFFHLRSSPFWHLVPKLGQEQEISRIGQVDTLSHLDRLVLGASLDENLFTLLQTEDGNNLLRGVLINSYFAIELHPILLAQSMVNLEVFNYSQFLTESYQQPNGANRLIVPKPTIRDRGFRQAIIQLYNHRCAFCGVRMLTPDGRSVVDAAHIIPWSVSHNDNPHNGMALCRLCHWTFDVGLSGLSQQYLVLLSEELRTSVNLAGHLLALEHRSIIGPDEQSFWPDLDAIRWHRQNIFRRL